MSFFIKRLTESLKDAEFKREWEKSEVEYQATRDAIIIERLEQLEADPSSAIPWKEVRRDEEESE